MADTEEVPKDLPLSDIEEENIRDNDILLGMYAVCCCLLTARCGTLA